MATAREETQQKMARLSAATLAHTPSQRHTVADRFEERATAVPERAFLRYAGRSLDYRGFNAAANRVAHVAR